jgi:hypothetical protein
MKTFYKITTDGLLQLGSGTVIPNGFTEYTKGSEPQELLDALAIKDLDQAKAIKSTQIEDDYNLAESQTVEVKLITYKGGNDSVVAIDSYVRLNRLAGATTHDVWDVNGTETPLSDADADAVIIAIGSQASVNKFTKKNRKVALSKATTIAEVEVI